MFSKINTKNALQVSISLSRRHSFGSSRNLPSPRGLLKSREHSLPLVCSSPGTGAEFAPKIGWRSLENYFRVSWRRLIV